MQLFRSLVLLQGLLCVSGCAFSLNPLYTKDIVVGDPDLSGTWEVVQPPDGERAGGFQTCVFKTALKDAKGTYWLTTIGSDETERDWLVDVLKLDDKLYVEMSPDEDDLAKLALYRVYRINVDGDELKIFFLNDQEFVKAAREEGLEFMDRDHPDRTILTAKTSELQQLYRKHADRFFHEKPSFVYRRQQTTADPK